LSVTTILRRSRWTGTLVAGFIALSVAILAALLLPERADAQEQATPKTTAKLVEHGDSLWTIAQAQLDSDATPQQVAEEVERLYALNRDRLLDNPDLLLVGQELFVDPALGEEQPRPNGEEPATTTSKAAEHVAEEPVVESVSALVTESMIEPATAEEEPAAEEGPSIEEGSSISRPEGVGGIAVDRKVLGLGILSLTALIAILIVVWRILIYRRPSSGSSLDYSQGYHRYGENYAGYYDNYAAWPRHQVHQEQKEEEEQVTEIEIFETGEAETNPEMPAAAGAAGTGQTDSPQHRLGPEFDRQNPNVLDERSMLEGDLDSYWDRVSDPGKSRWMMTVQPATPGWEASGSFWVKYPHPLIILKIEARLKAAGYTCYGEALSKEEVSVNDAPSSMIYCPKEDDDVVPEVERLHSAAGDIPIVVLGSRLGSQLAQRILLAGAAYIVDLERHPEQGAGFLTAAFEDETAIPRDFFETMLAKAISRTGPIVLTPEQRRFLELVVEAPVVADNIMVPKELLRAFLVKVEGRLEEEPLSSMGGRAPVA
jgi:DNA-binding NarL/FixJ family response regulator